jgi:hypothetical protein
MSKKNRPCILTVTIKRMIDEYPDTSWLGEYSDDPKDYAIIARGESEGEFLDRTPCSNCPHAHWQHARKSDARTDREIGQCYVNGCDCDEYDPRYPDRGRTYRFFNPWAENYKGEPEAEVRKYCLQDYARTGGLNNGDWWFLGVRVDARVQLTGDLCQDITSGGLWGIESDSEANYIEEVIAEQKAELRTELLALGFSPRQINLAFNLATESEVQ